MENCIISEFENNLTVPPSTLDSRKSLRRTSLIRNKNGSLCGQVIQEISHESQDEEKVPFNGHLPHCNLSIESQQLRASNEKAAANKNKSKDQNNHRRWHESPSFASNKKRVINVIEEGSV